MSLNQILISNPDYQQACQITDNSNADHFAPVVKQLCQVHGIEFQGFKKINGWANLIFDIDDQWIIKIAAPNWAIQCQREIAALQLLRNHVLPIAIPTLLHHGKLNGWVYMITNKLPGTNLHELWTTLDQGAQYELITQVGDFAKQLNSLPITDKDSDILAVDWPSFLQKQTEGCYERRKKQGLCGPLLADLSPFLADVNYHPAPAKMCLQHCDLHAGNLLAECIDGKWRLTGVIDFGDALICDDVHYEWISSMILLSLGNKALNRAFLASYGASMDNVTELQRQLMVLSLLRHSGEMGYCLDQVSGCNELSNWQSVAERFFAL